MCRMSAWNLRTMTFVMPTTREISLPSEPSTRLYSPYRLLLNASKLIMRPERVAEEQLDPCLGKRTPDMTKHISRSLGQCLKMVLHIREQEREITAVMIMSHDPSRDAPEPFNAVGIRIIGRGRDQVQVLLQLDQHAAHEQGPSRRVRLEIVSDHDGDASATLGAGHGGTHLLTKHLSGASRRHSAIEPAIAPIQQPKAVDLAVISRSLDQTLPAPSFPRPDTRECRVKGKLYLILEVEISMRHERKQFRQINGKLIPQVSFHQILHG